eukprot:TRINITY_DN1966_c0_g1_i1.p1 TRINITY_DN1966_c0_g1~~TRINITY_DN1966_c0_g1_i1.p1  ORF type:complete len:415 (-),score=98.48 TRINITY_DN1966_c0_g1_i1:67-1311(-)
MYLTNGSVVTLLSHHMNYLSSNKLMTVYLDKSLENAQKWAIEIHGNKIAFKSCHGTYLKANIKYNLISLSDKLDIGTLWTMEQQRDGKMAIISCHNTYLRAGLTGANHVGYCRKWEKWTMNVAKNVQHEQQLYYAQILHQQQQLQQQYQVQQHQHYQLQQQHQTLYNYSLLLQAQLQQQQHTQQRSQQTQQINQQLSNLNTIKNPNMVPSHQYQPHDRENLNHPNPNQQMPFNQLIPQMPLSTSQPLLIPQLPISPQMPLSNPISSLSLSTSQPLLIPQLPISPQMPLSNPLSMSSSLSTSSPSLFIDPTVSFSNPIQTQLQHLQIQQLQQHLQQQRQQQQQLLQHQQLQQQVQQLQLQNRQLQQQAQIQQVQHIKNPNMIQPPQDPSTLPLPRPLQPQQLLFPPYPLSNDGNK